MRDMDKYVVSGDYAAERIRKAVEGAPKPDAESDAERACAALLDWRDQVAGMLGIDAGSMADEVQDAIMAELDKRLMPPGMEWMRFGDGERVEFGDAWLDGVGDPHVLHAVEFLDEKAALMGARVIMRGRTYSNDDSIEYNLWPGERVKRPEPEVLGADGLPIKVGDTVYTPAGTKMTVRNITGDMVSAGIPTSDRAHAHMLARFLTHTTPDTNERIDKDASMPPRRYYADKIGHDVGLKDDEEVFAAVALDLLRRQRELDAKTMGGDAE
ncbi:hypothetical protein [Eggerthella timonensis]|uniref:hypothetical protein n=1 Tax=Eggerthella timonensis TaxID=1871008 RepID=UPI000C778BA9|nr:hypothetical protein [Eggerthella timonensis]